MNQDAVAALLERLPASLDKQGKLDGAPWDEARKLFDELLAGGREALLSLIGLLREVDDGTDWRARYVTHGLAIHLGDPGRERERALFASTLASQIVTVRPPPVQGFLIRQIQVAGTKNEAGTLGKCLLDEELHEYAAQALLAIREGAVEEFRKAAGTAAGKRKLTIVQALGVLKDAASSAMLREAARDADRELRLAAVWALANIGDPGATEIVLKAADSETPFERIKGTHSCLLLAERLLAAGRKGEAVKLWGHLRDTRSDPSERYVREAAERGLEGASQNR